MAQNFESKMAHDFDWNSIDEYKSNLSVFRYYKNLRHICKKYTDPNFVSDIVDMETMEIVKDNGAAGRLRGPKRFGTSELAITKTESDNDICKEEYEEFLRDPNAYVKVPGMPDDPLHEPDHKEAFDQTYIVKALRKVRQSADIDGIGEDVLCTLDETEIDILNSSSSDETYSYQSESYYTSSQSSSSEEDYSPWRCRDYTKPHQGVTTPEQSHYRTNGSCGSTSKGSETRPPVRTAGHMGRSTAKLMKLHRKEKPGRSFKVKNWIKKRSRQGSWSRGALTDSVKSEKYSFKRILSTDIPKMFNFTGQSTYDNEKENLITKEGCSSSDGEEECETTSRNCSGRSVSDINSQIANLTFQVQPSMGQSRQAGSCTKPVSGLNSSKNEKRRIVPSFVRPLASSENRQARDGGEHESTRPSGAFSSPSAKMTKDLQALTLTESRGRESGSANHPSGRTPKHCHQSAHSVFYKQKQGHSRLPRERCKKERSTKAVPEETVSLLTEGSTEDDSSPVRHGKALNSGNSTSDFSSDDVHVIESDGNDQLFVPPISIIRLGSDTKLKDGGSHVLPTSIAKTEAVNTSNTKNYTGLQTSMKPSTPKTESYQNANGSWDSVSSSVVARSLYKSTDTDEAKYMNTEGNSSYGRSSNLKRCSNTNRAAFTSPVAFFKVMQRKKERQREHITPNKNAQTHMGKRNEVLTKTDHTPEVVIQKETSDATPDMLEDPAASPENPAESQVNNTTPERDQQEMQDETIQLTAFSSTPTKQHNFGKISLDISCIPSAVDTKKEKEDTDCVIIEPEFNKQSSNDCKEIQAHRGFYHRFKHASDSKPWTDKPDPLDSQSQKLLVQRRPSSETLDKYDVSDPESASDINETFTVETPKTRKLQSKLYSPQARSNESQNKPRCISSLGLKYASPSHKVKESKSPRHGQRNYPLPSQHMQYTPKRNTEGSKEGSGSSNSDTSSVSRSHTFFSPGHRFHQSSSNSKPKQTYDLLRNPDCTKHRSSMSCSKGTAASPGVRKSAAEEEGISQVGWGFSRPKTRPRAKKELDVYHLSESSDSDSDSPLPRLTNGRPASLKKTVDRHRTSADRPLTGSGSVVSERVQERDETVHNADPIEDSCSSESSDVERPLLDSRNGSGYTYSSQCLGPGKCEKTFCFMCA